MNLSSTIQQLNIQIQIMKDIKSDLSSGDINSILNIFTKNEQKNYPLSRYIPDTRPLLDTIAEYLNKLVIDTPFSFTNSSLQRNGASLSIIHLERGRIGELSLSKKNLSIHKSIFLPYLTEQKEIEYLIRELPTMETYSNRLAKDYKRYLSYPKIWRKIKGLDKKNIEKLKKVFEHEQKQMEEGKERVSNATVQLADVWEKELLLYQQTKSLMSIFEEIDFSNNFHLMNEINVYQMYHREQINHHYSNNSSYEEGHLSLLNIDEWNNDDTIDLKPFSFDRVGFDHLQVVLEELEGQLNVIRHAEDDTLIVKVEEGSLTIERNGKFIIQGEDLTLFHFLCYPTIRNLLFVKSTPKK